MRSARGSLLGDHRRGGVDHGHRRALLANPIVQVLQGAAAGPNQGVTAVAVALAANDNVVNARRERRTQVGKLTGPVVTALIIGPLVLAHGAAGQ